MNISTGRNLFASLVMTLTPVVVYCAPIGSGDATRIPVAPQDGSTVTQSRFADRGVDLVVSKVLFAKGVFGGSEKIKFQIWIKNLCGDPVSQRIKVSLPFISRAVWIEGGISGKQEKSTAAYYMNPAEYRCCGGDVVVDPNRVIEETQETNNSCTARFSPASETRRVTHCPAQVPRCRDRKPPQINKKYQMR